MYVHGVTETVNSTKYGFLWERSSHNRNSHNIRMDDENLQYVKFRVLEVARERNPWWPSKMLIRCFMLFLHSQWFTRVPSSDLIVYYIHYISLYFIFYYIYIYIYVCLLIHNLFHHSNAAVQDAASEPRCPSRHGAKASRAEGLRLNPKAAPNP